MTTLSQWLVNQRSLQIDYLIDGIDTHNDKWRNQIYIAIQYKVSSDGRWVNARNELKAE